MSAQIGRRSLRLCSCPGVLETLGIVLEVGRDIAFYSVTCKLLNSEV